jgi:hypothetical protein
MALTLAELESFDPQAPPSRGNERRFCCPLPECAGKPRDTAHRSLCVNVSTGQWLCNRCHNVGILGEFKETREPEPRLYAPSTRRVQFPAPEKPPVLTREWMAELRDLKPLAGTPGEGYLSGRAIPTDLAHSAGVRFAPGWYGRPAVVFPVRSRDGALVATAGRYIDDKAPKTRDAGHKTAGCFATPGAWAADPLILCEGPADALSLHLAGYPAVALLGCNLSDVVAWSCALRRVAVALDADAAGDAASAKLLAALDVRGARAFRVRPPDGRDWNDLLREWGSETLASMLAITLKAAAPPSPPIAAPTPPEAGWTPEDQAAHDATLGEVAAALPDGDLIPWLRERFGCVLTLDDRGGLKAENAAAVPAPVRDEVRRRARALTQQLKQR